MLNHIPVLPLTALGQNLKPNADKFRSDVSQLNRDQALKTIARLNIITEETSDFESQHLALQKLIEAELIDEMSISRLQKYLARGPSAETFFTRAHAFELFRAISLWANPEESLDLFSDSACHKNKLIRSILMAYELHSLRVQLPVVNALQTLREPNIESLRMLRECCLMRSNICDAVSVLGRGFLFVDQFFFNGPGRDHKQEFEDNNDMSVEMYRECSTALLAATSHKKDVIKAGEMESLFDIKLEILCEQIPHKQEVFQKFLDLESIKSADLNKLFVNQSTLDSVSIKGLREKPIFSFLDNSYIVSDVNLLAERATYGPFFYKTNNDKQKFEKFGDAFEEYIKQIFNANERSWGFNRVRATPKDHPRFDLWLESGSVCAIAEIKCKWIDDQAVYLSAPDFWKIVEKKYSICANEKVGIGQLAEAIKDSLQREIVSSDFNLQNYSRVYPLLIVHDIHLLTPNIGYLFANNFWDYLNLTPPKLGYHKIKDATVFSPILLTIAEVERLETCLGPQTFFDLITAYCKKDPLRINGIRSFINPIAGRQSSAYARGQSAIDELKDRLFVDQAAN
ncbi:MAG: hypothetical protein Q8T09_15030 [Candidatus Melainabacteria bacterium]|nr:hypothetical protein [Candidatus Melainabacteria bacterium]